MSFPPASPSPIPRSSLLLMLYHHQQAIHAGPSFRKILLLLVASDFVDGYHTGNRKRKKRKYNSKSRTKIKNIILQAIRAEESDFSVTSGPELRCRTEESCEQGRLLSYSSTLPEHVTHLLLHPPTIYFPSGFAYRHQVLARSVA